MRKLTFFFLMLSLSIFGEKISTPFLALPLSASSFSVLNDNSSYIDFSLAGFGPNWSYLSIRGTLRSSANTMKASNHAKSGGAELSIDVTAEPIKNKQFKLTYVTTTSETIPVTMIAVGLNFDPAAFENGKIKATTQDGQETELSIPLGKGGVGKNIKTCVLIDSDGAETKLMFEPACDIASDGQARTLLAEGTLSGTSSQEITVTLPEKLTFYSTPEEVPFETGFDKWYPFTPSDRFEEESEIGMADWIEKPAGKYGRISRKDDQLIYNEKPIKLWGLNVTYGGCAPDHDLAERRAAMYSK